MPKTRQQKEETVKTLVEDLNNSKSLIMTNYQGLKVTELEAMRDKMREEDVTYKIVKNTLFEVARAKSNLKDLDLVKQPGQVAIAIGFSDEIAPAKLIYKAAKENKNMEIMLGVLDGKIIDAKAVEALAKLPSKQELLAKLVGSINAPVSGFVNVLAGNLRGLVNVLNSIKDSKGATN